MALDRYAIEARARADELLDQFSEEKIDILSKWLQVSADEELFHFILTLSPKIETILAQTPAKDRVWAEKTPRSQYVREWLAARHWAILSARALSIAAELEDAPRMKDRQFYRSGARVADRWLVLPDKEDLLSLRLLDE